MRTFLRDSVPRHLLERVLTAACRPNNVYTAESPQSYRDRRSRISEMPYRTLVIARSDEAAHMRLMVRKLEFFCAPAGLFNDVDRRMGAARCRSPGMYLQTVTLLLQRRRPRIMYARGVSLYRDSVAEILRPPPETDAIAACPSDIPARSIWRPHCRPSGHRWAT